MRNPPFKINSIRFRVTILYSAILALILFFFSGAILFYSYYILRENLDHDLMVKAREIKTLFKAYEKIASLEKHPFSQILKMFDNHYLGSSTKTVLNDLWVEQFKMLDIEKDYINILSDDDRTLLRSTSLGEDFLDNKKVREFFNKKDIIYSTFFLKRKLYRAINLPIIYRKRILIIQIYTSLSPVTAIVIKLLLFVLFVICGIVFLTGYMGRIITSQILKPVAAITRLANSISHKNLNQRIKENINDVEMQLLVNSFNQMIERLQQSFGYINDFSAQVAHELKTPLAIMRGEMELARNSASEEDEIIISNCLEEIERMLKVINDLLSLAKIENQADVFNFSPIVIRDFILDICDAARVLALPKNIKVCINEIPQELTINGDKFYLRRLFLNIISNAVKFTPLNGMIKIECRRNKNKIEINITDNGIGISLDNQRHVFDRFFRVHSDNFDEYHGTGLGLCIALSIAKMHNGTILVDSEINKGSNFKIILPCE